MSTFTDWNGPQGGGARAADLIQLANAYSELVAKLDQHMSDKTPGTSDVHGIKTYVEAQIATIRGLIPSVSAFITETAADNKYALKSQLPTDIVHSADIANFATNAAVAALLADYLKTSDLASQQIIKDIKDDIDALELALNIIPFTMPIFKATDYIEGLIHAVEQVKFIDKAVATVVGGADVNGKYWLIGMQTDKRQAGIALIKYGNTKPFSAVVNFAASKANGNYNGALTVVTDTVISGLKFKLVYGTDNNGNEHVYLAVQAPDWLKLNNLEISASGINFCPIGSEGCILPNGNCHNIVDCFTKAGLSASNFNIPIGHVGEVIGWSKFDEDGVPVDFPSSCHVCDGTPVDPDEWPELIAKGITSFPLVDYHLIVGSTTDAGGNSSESLTETYSVVLVPAENGTASIDKTEADAGDIVTITATPDSGYRLKSITVIDNTGANVPLIGENTFAMPEADVVVSVAFEALYSTILMPTENGSFSVDKAVANAGDIVTINTVPATGYRVKSITIIDDTETNVPLLSENTFAMPAADVAITVTFEVVMHKVTLVGTDFPNPDCIYCPGEATPGSTIRVHHVDSDAHKYSYSNNMFIIQSNQLIANLVAYNLTDDSEITITKVFGTDYIFTMPDADVIINVDFAV